MCDKALWDSFLQMEQKIDKYKSNWGSLLEYIDMSASANVTGALVSAFDKISDEPEMNYYTNKSSLKEQKAGKSTILKKTRDPLSTGYCWRRSPKKDETNYSQSKYNNRNIRSVTRENVPAVGVQLTNCPLHKAIYKLQSKDNITGFSRRTIFKGFKRLNNTFIKNETNVKSSFEKFPEKQIQQELEANSINYNKARSDVTEAEIYKWIKSKGKITKDLVTDKEILEFTKNMFLAWDVGNNTKFSIEKIVEELITFGITTTNRILTAMVKSFKGKESNNESINANDFLNFMANDKITTHISNILRRIIDKKEMFNIIPCKSNNIISESPKKSLNYKVPNTDGTIIEIPLFNEPDSQKVILHSNNSQDEKISMQFIYNNKGNLIDQKIAKISKKENNQSPNTFVKMLKPQTKNQSVNYIERKSSSKKINEEIKVIKGWWAEIEKAAGYKEDIPINIVADLLVSKSLVENRDRAKQLLGSTVKHPKQYVDFSDFRELLYKGVFKNAIKDICQELELQHHNNTEELKLPKFLQISNYKKKLLMTAFDPSNPNYKQGSKIFEIGRAHV